METRKLYYEDCHRTSFSARVMDCFPRGDGFAVTLDATVFYPEGGGQPCDLGILGGAQVLDVQEEAGQVVHLCDRPLIPGGEVFGEIDYLRRFDLMQQHTGEHILSGLLSARFGCHNVGFHMGEEVVTIDFDTPIPESALPEIELAANEVIWQDLPLRVWVPEEGELETIPYRSKRRLPWPVRLVEIPGVDRCACCGVHVARTGEVGILKLLSLAKFHQGVRMELVCGRRAYALLCRTFDQNRQVCQAFSAQMDGTGEAARRMNQALAQEKFRRGELEKRIFAAIGEHYRGAGNVLHFEPDLAPGQVRLLADAIGDCCGGIAAVFSPNGSGFSYCLLTRTGDLRPLGRAMTQALSGRGGGKSGFQQGSVCCGSEEIRTFFHRVWA